MIGKILTGLLSFIIYLIQALLSPIDNLINYYLPTLSNALDSVAGFLNIALQSIGWVISLTGLSSDVISIVVLYYGFALTVPILIYFIKLVLNWYDKLKP